MHGSAPATGADLARAAFTIGHSNHSLDAYLALLRTHEIEVVADVRSAPRSRYSPQFDRASLERELREAQIGYVYLGAELGGRPVGDEFYDERGRVRYDRRAESAEFQTGIERLLAGIERYRVAVMCSEEDPQRCHRRLLVGRELLERGTPVRHIRGDGSVELEATAPELPTLDQPQLL
jgi:uncharacterized protein (DUF488 family)